MSLPNFQSSDFTVNQMQSVWAKILNPIIAAPLTHGVLEQNVVLKVGLNNIDHKLPDYLQGWMIVRQRGVSTIYDNQDNNPLPAKSLWLMASSGVSIDIFMF